MAKTKMVIYGGMRLQEWSLRRKIAYAKHLRSRMKENSHVRFCSAGGVSHTTGETDISAVEGQPDTVSAVAEPVTRIPSL